MPIPNLPTFEWTEEDIQAARLRGKKLALQKFKSGVKEAFDADDAWDLMESEGLFEDRSPGMRKTMAHEMADGYTRFAKELREASE